MGKKKFCLGICLYAHSNWVCRMCTTATEPAMAMCCNSSCHFSYIPLFDQWCYLPETVVYRTEICLSLYPIILRQMFPPWNVPTCCGGSHNHSLFTSLLSWGQSLSGLLLGCTFVSPKQQQKPPPQPPSPFTSNNFTNQQRFFYHFAFALAQL